MYKSPPVERHSHNREQDSPLAQAIAYALCKKHNMENAIDITHVQGWAKDKSESQIQEAMQQIEHGAKYLQQEITTPQEAKAQSTPEKALATPAPTIEKKR